MRSFEQTASLIDLIYQASLKAALWPEVLRQLQASFGGCGVVLGVQAKGAPEFLEVTGFDREAMHRLGRHYAAKTSGWSPMPGAPEGGLLLDRRLMPGFIRRQDLQGGALAAADDTLDCAVFPLLRHQSLTAFVLFARSFTAGAFDPETLDFLQNLAMHLQRAVEIQARLEQATLQAALALKWVENLDDATLFVTWEGRVLFANQAAERMLTAREAGLVLQDSRLRGKTREANTALDRLLAEAFAEGRQAVGVAMVKRNARRPVAVYCSRLADSPEGRPSGEPAAVLVLCDMENGMRTPAGLLRELFGLSAAEARLAFRLANGDSLSDAAAAFGVAKSTVVSQLGGIFSKTQTSRQSELIGLLRDLPRHSV